jgi:hypothetical protein
MRLPQQALKARDHPVPALSEGDLPRLVRQGGTARCIQREGLQGHSEILGTPGIHQDPATTVSHQLASGSVVEAHARQAAGQGFQDHVAEGLRQAGKSEEVSAGVVSSQVVAATRPSEDGVGTRRLQFAALGAIADQEQTRARVDTLQGLPGLHPQQQVFFGCQSPDRRHHQIVGPDAPARAQ